MSQPEYNRAVNAFVPLTRNVELERRVLLAPPVRRVVRRRPSMPAQLVAEPQAIQQRPVIGQPVIQPRPISRRRISEAPVRPNLDAFLANVRRSIESGQAQVRNERRPSSFFSRGRRPSMIAPNPHRAELNVDVSNADNLAPMAYVESQSCDKNKEGESAAISSAEPDEPKRSASKSYFDEPNVNAETQSSDANAQIAPIGLSVDNVFGPDNLQSNDDVASLEQGESQLCDTNDEEKSAVISSAEPDEPKRGASKSDLDKPNVNVESQLVNVDLPVVRESNDIAVDQAHIGNDEGQSTNDSPELRPNTYQFQQLPAPFNREGRRPSLDCFLMRIIWEEDEEDEAK